MTDSTIDAKDILLHKLQIVLKLRLFNLVTSS